MFLLENVKENLLRISTMTWFFSIFNKFEKNSLIKFYIVEIEYRKYQTIFLFDSKTQEYAFVNEKIVKDICEAFQIIVVSLSYVMHFNKFDDFKVKFVTYVILSALTIQNYNELSISMFIIKIENHFIILNKFWINKHKMIIDEKNDFIHFKFDRCDHARLNSRFKSNKIINFRKFWLSSSFKSRKTSFSINFQKYKILQRRKTLSRFIVKNSNEKKFQKNFIIIDVSWSLISVSEFFFIVTEKKDNFKISKKFSLNVVRQKLLNIKVLKLFWSRRRDAHSNLNVLNCFHNFRNLKTFLTMTRF